MDNVDEAEHKEEELDEPTEFNVDYIEDGVSLEDELNAMLDE